MGTREVLHDGLGQVLSVTDDRELDAEKVWRLREVRERFDRAMRETDIEVLGLMQPPVAHARRQAQHTWAKSAADKIAEATTLEELDAARWTDDIAKMEEL